jgi:hypothetical protein
MGAQLPDAEASGGVAATLAVAPTVGEPSARRGWTRNLDLAVPGALVGLLLFLCFVWPLFGTVPKPTGGNILDANVPSFSSGHPLGSDQVGNDLWSRLLYGGRNSLEIAFAVNLVGLVLGGLLGAFAALPDRRPGAQGPAPPRAARAAGRATARDRRLRPRDVGLLAAPARGRGRRRRRR